MPIRVIIGKQLHTYSKTRFNDISVTQRQPLWVPEYWQLQQHQIRQTRTITMPYAHVQT